jgi:predicted Zn-dependent protease
MPAIHEQYDEAIETQQKGDVEGAVGKLCELLKEAPDYSLAHAALSVFYSKLERHDEAVEHARKVCDLESDDPFSYIAFSLICQKAGLMREAEQAMMLARQAQMAGQDRPPV